MNTPQHHQDNITHGVVIGQPSQLGASGKDVSHGDRKRQQMVGNLDHGHAGPLPGQPAPVYVGPQGDCYRQQPAGVMNYGHSGPFPTRTFQPTENQSDYVIPGLRYDHTIQPLEPNNPNATYFNPNSSNHDANPNPNNTRLGQMTRSTPPNNPYATSYNPYSTSSTNYDANLKVNESGFINTTSSMTPDNLSKHVDRTLALKIKHLFSMEWQRVFRYLGLSNSDIDNTYTECQVTDESVYRLLVQWIGSVESPTRLRLVQCLRKVSGHEEAINVIHMHQQ